jgi:protein gp37
MGADSDISWCHDTISPWIGCAAVSPACANCYAEVYANRFGLAEWGPGGTRKVRVEKAIGELRAAANRARRMGQPRRVFVASLSDVFEERDDLVEPRKRLWDALHAIAGDNPVRLDDGRRALAVLCLTKRPDCMEEWANEHGWPSGCWAGTTVEDQRRADERIPWLLQVPAPVRFLSCEPLLGALSLQKRLNRGAESWAEGHPESPRPKWPGGWTQRGPSWLRWVIAGGESGPKARPSHPSLFRSLLRQCFLADVPFHFKQWGEWAPVEWSCATDHGEVGACRVTLGDGYPDGAPWVRGWRFDGGTLMARVGRREAGRVLNGVVYDDVPRFA